MKSEVQNMIQPELYKSATSLLESPILKAVIAALLALFPVPLEFVVAVPIFWILDFGSGIYAAKRDGLPITSEKLNDQYVKMGIKHIPFLIGCVVIANLFGVPKFIIFGFGYIITTEFISTIRNLFGDKKSVQIISHFKEMLVRTIGLDLPDVDESDKVNGEDEAK